jgi:hypothetical protein
MRNDPMTFIRSMISTWNNWVEPKPCMSLTDKRYAWIPNGRHRRLTEKPDPQWISTAGETTQRGPIYRAYLLTLIYLHVDLCIYPTLMSQHPTTDTKTNPKQDPQLWVPLAIVIISDRIQFQDDSWRVWLRPVCPCTETIISRKRWRKQGTAATRLAQHLGSEICRGRRIRLLFYIGLVCWARWFHFYDWSSVRSWYTVHRIGYWDGRLYSPYQMN